MFLRENDHEPWNAVQIEWNKLWILQGHSIKKNYIVQKRSMISGRWEVPSDTNQPDVAKPRVFLTSKTLFWNLDPPTTQKNWQTYPQPIMGTKKWVGKKKNTDKINKRNQQQPWGDHEWCLEVGAKDVRLSSCFSIRIAMNPIAKWWTNTVSSE